MIRHLLALLLSLPFTLPVPQLFAQQFDGDKPAQQYTVNLYQKALGNQTQLYRGVAYEFYDASSVGSPYFKESVAFSNGNLVYAGTTYNNIPLLYDEFKRLVVTTLHDNFSKLALIPEQISEMSLHGHQFIRLWPDEQTPNLVPDLYDKLYSNKSELFARRVKTREEEGTSGKKVYRVKDVYYIKKGGVYHPVNSNGQLWDTFEDKKKELKRYLKDKNLNLSDERERVLIMLVTYYDQISN